MGGKHFLVYASKILQLPPLPQVSFGHDEKLLHERNFTIGHNQCKGASAERDKLLISTLRSIADRVSSDTYDHAFRPCPHLLVQSRHAPDDPLALYSLHTELEQCVIPKVLRLVRFLDGHRIYILAIELLPA